MVNVDDAIEKLSVANANINPAQEEHLTFDRVKVVNIAWLDA